MTALGFVALAGFVLAIVFGLFIEERVCAKVRARHPEVWRELGAPDRYFDDGGLARRSAVRRLSREPVLLRQCAGDIARQVRFARSFGKVCFALALVGLALCLAYAVAEL